MWISKTRLRHASLPFDSLPYPTRTICRRVRSVNHVTTKGKEVDHNLWVWGSVPRALRARGSPATNHSQTPSKTKQNLSSVNPYFISFGSVPATLKPSMVKFSRKRRRPHVISSEKNSAHDTFGRVNEEYLKR